MPERPSLLDRILEPGSLSVDFQPVVDIQTPRPRAHYFEALTRGPRGTSLEQPTILFEYARKKSREAEVDRACVEEIFASVSALPRDAALGLNVHASTLAMDDSFVAFLSRALDRRRVSGRRLVVEVIEHAPPWNLPKFRAAVKSLRALGVRLALDDVGLGHSNYMMVLECRPDYLKVDRYFVTGCHDDFYRKAVLSSIAQLARPFGARVIAEGVEDARDLAVLKRLGITLVQGHLFGRPAAAAEVTDFTAGVPGERSGGRPWFLERALGAVL